MSYRLIAASVLIMGVVATPAFAESNFSGLYAGAQIGAAKTDRETRVVTPTARGSRSGDKTALTGGVFAGYGGMLSDSIYLGGEAALGGTGGKASRTTLAGIPTQTKGGLNGSLSGRLGYVFGESNMIYGRLGVETQRTEFLQPNGRTAKSNVSGALYGIGYERTFGDGFSGRVELNHADYGDKSFAGATAGTRVTYEPSQTRLMVGAAFRF